MADAAIVFDLDGTLVDSAPDLHGAAARMLAQEGHPPLPPETVRHFIGNGVPKLVERIIGACGLDMADHPRLTASFLNHYKAHLTDLTRPYPGVVDALARLQMAGYALGVCTNKPEAPARAILDALDLARFFAVVVGGDTLPVRKPDPAGMLQAFGSLGATARLYVGDSETDAETAQNGNTVFALFTGGYRKTAVSAIPHARAFDHFETLPGMADALLGTTRLI